MDGSNELKCSDCIELAQSMQKLKKIISLKIVGDCCGTDNTHMNEIANVISSTKASGGMKSE